MKTKTPSFWIKTQKLNKEREKSLKELDRQGSKVANLKWG